MVRLSGLTVCVGYADLFFKSINRWKAGLQRLVVVTSPEDQATQDLCKDQGAEVYATDVFYASGAAFNKGAAMSEAVFMTGLREGDNWLVTFDADIVPPYGWQDVVTPSVRPGFLYGAHRYEYPEDTDVDQLKEINTCTRMPQGWVLGFFAVFHNSDPHLPNQTQPLFDICWPHAGAYDTTFCRRWPTSHQVILPVPMIHLGKERANWMGRGDQRAMSNLIRLRGMYGTWEWERMPNPPEIRKPQWKVL